MKKNSLPITRKLSSILVLTIFLASSAVVCAQECAIIRINEELGSSGKVIQAVPETLQVSKGTCVIWVNWVTAQEVRVSFKEEGKKCEDATDAPMGFQMAENCYVTNFLPLGGTSSLRFNEAGTFTYEVEVPGERKATGPLGLGHGEVQGKGQIVVR